MDVVIFVSDHFPGNGDFAFAAKIIGALQVHFAAGLNGHSIRFNLVSYERGMGISRDLFARELPGTRFLTVDEFNADPIADDHYALFIEVATIHQYLQSLIHPEGSVPLTDAQAAAWGIGGGIPMRAHFRTAPRIGRYTQRMLLVPEYSMGPELQAPLLMAMQHYLVERGSATLLMPGARRGVRLVLPRLVGLRSDSVAFRADEAFAYQGAAEGAVPYDQARDEAGILITPNLTRLRVPAGLDGLPLSGELAREVGAEIGAGERRISVEYSSRREHLGRYLSSYIYLNQHVGGQHIIFSIGHGKTITNARNYVVRHQEKLRECGFTRVLIVSNQDGRTARIQIGEGPDKPLVIIAQKRVSHEDMIRLVRLSHVAGGTGDQSLSELISQTGNLIPVYEALGHKLVLASSLLGYLPADDEIYPAVRWLLGLGEDGDGRLVPLGRRAHLLNDADPQVVAIRASLANPGHQDRIRQLVAHWRQNLDLMRHLNRVVGHALGQFLHVQQGLPLPAALPEDTAALLHEVTLDFSGSIRYQCRAHQDRMGEWLPPNTQPLQELFIQGLARVFRANSRCVVPQNLAEEQCQWILSLLLREDQIGAGLVEVADLPLPGFRDRTLPASVEVDLSVVLAQIIKDAPGLVAEQAIFSRCRQIILSRLRLLEERAIHLEPKGCCGCSVGIGLSADYRNHVDHYLALLDQVPVDLPRAHGALEGYAGSIGCFYRSTRRMQTTLLRAAVASGNVLLIYVAARFVQSAIAGEYFSARARSGLYHVARDLEQQAREGIAEPGLVPNALPSNALLFAWVAGANFATAEERLTMRQAIEDNMIHNLGR